MRNRTELAIRAHAAKADADRRLVRSLPRGRWVTQFSLRPFIPPPDNKPGWWIDVWLLVTRISLRVPPDLYNDVVGRLGDLLSDLASCSWIPFPAVRAGVSRVRP